MLEPPDGETTNGVISKPRNMAYLAYTTIGEVLRNSRTYTTIAPPLPLA